MHVVRFTLYDLIDFNFSFVILYFHVAFGYLPNRRRFQQRFCYSTVSCQLDQLIGSVRLLRTLYEWVIAKLGEPFWAKFLHVLFDFLHSSFRFFLTRTQYFSYITLHISISYKMYFQRNFIVCFFYLYLSKPNSISTQQQYLMIRFIFYRNR